MRQTAPFAMDRHSIVGEVADRVGLVLADDEPRFGAQQGAEGAGEASVAVEQDCRVPRPNLAIEDRRKTVERDEGRGSASRCALVERHRDPLMVGSEDRFLGGPRALRHQDRDCRGSRSTRLKHR